jgi:hypothetical protein
VRAGHRLGGDGTSVWKSLYFGHEGTVDINSTSANQKSFIVDGESIFSTAFRRTFDAGRMPKSEIDANGDGLIEWQEFFPKLTKQAQAMFRERLGTYYDAALGKKKPAYSSLAKDEQNRIDDMIKQGTLTPEFLDDAPTTIHLRP